jgi:hypothetical protein
MVESAPVRSSEGDKITTTTSTAAPGQDRPPQDNQQSIEWQSNMKESLHSLQNGMMTMRKDFNYRAEENDRSIKRIEEKIMALSSKLDKIHNASTTTSKMKKDKKKNKRKGKGKNKENKSPQSIVKAEKNNLKTKGKNKKGKGSKADRKKGI